MMKEYVNNFVRRNGISGLYTFLPVFVLVLLTLFFSGRALQAASDTKEAVFQDPYSDEIQQVFDILKAVGNASNNGDGDQEALRQVCALFQQHSSATIKAVMEEQFHKSAFFSHMTDRKVGAALYEKGQGTLSTYIFSACVALTGQANVEPFAFDREDFKTMAFGMAVDEGVGILKNSGLPFAGNLEISGRLFGDGNSNWEVLTVQPLWHDETNQHHLFTQLSWNHITGRKGYAEGDTLNAGFAYRHLSDDQKILYGINTFFDHSRKRNHNRMSIGADIQTSEIGASVNKYIPLSDWKNVDPYVEEKASSGFDLELQGRMPELPSWQMNLKGYQWSSNQDMAQEKTWGYDASLQWIPVNAVVWQAGLNNEQDADPSFYTQLRVVYKFGKPVENMLKKRLQLASMEERVYDKVRRDNAMRVEQRIKDIALVRVVETIGSNTAKTRGGTVDLSSGERLPMPFTAHISAAGGSVARLSFFNGGVLTIGAGSAVRVDLDSITLLSGVFQYVSGATNVVINVPGGTVTLLGTDVDVSSDGITSILRVRDGQAVLAGIVAGSMTLNPAQAASAVSGVVGAALASNNSDYITHTDSASEKIDRVASAQTGEKVTPYPNELPRLTATATMPGDIIMIGLKFNTVVAVTGVPRLVLNIEGTTRYATYSTGGGTDDLSFTYTLQATDEGATSITVESLELNGGMVTGNSKNAVTTIADAVLDLSGSVNDVTAPSGYAVSFITDPVTVANQSAVAFQVTSAEVGTAYDYTISSSGGGTDVTGSGAITTATQNVTGIDVSGLGDGTLTLSLTLTDDELNTGGAVTNIVNKEIISLSLDFVAGTYEINGISYGSVTALPGWNFSRASPAMTYAEDTAGNLVAFAANTPRITDKGFLIEESSTNLLLQSALNTGWVSAGTTPPAVLDNQSHLGIPCGSVTFTPLSDTDYAGSRAQRTTYRASVVAGNEYKASMYISLSRTLTGSESIIYYYTGSNGYSQYVIDASNSAQYVGKWGRVISSRTSQSLTGLQYPVVFLDTAMSSDVTVYMSRGQVEQSSFVSSYIPTTDSIVTRNPDLAYLTPISSWYNVSEGTMLAEAQWQGGALAGGVFALNDNSTNNRIDLRAYQRAVHFTQSAMDTNLNPFSFSDYLSHKLAIGYSATTAVASKDGAAVLSGIPHVPIGVDRLWIGNIDTGAHPLSGYLKELRYYPLAKSNAELQTLSTL